ncbi:kinesin-like protein KIF14 [Amphiura filiformis]|uniref:kinesin-like protein KIF14 n=1 Tax=Amphiura filiformis TaxID=82378 RepID=UPI003B20C422
MSWTPLRSTNASTSRFSTKPHNGITKKNGKENHFLTPQRTPRYMSNRAETLCTARKSDATTKPESPNLSKKSSTFRTPLSATPTRKDSVSSSHNGTPECFNKVEFDTPCTPRMRRGSYRSSVSGTPSRSSVSGTPSRCEDSVDLDGFSVTVAVRVRPFSKKEVEDRDVKCVVSMDGNETKVKARGSQVNSFCYDHCFWSFDSVHGNFSGQDTVYEQLGVPLLDNAFEGFNTCLFAYGQTGSGKSYTIMGYDNEVGVIPRFSRDLFRRIEDPQEPNVSFAIEISFFEIYNEKIHDLLAAGTNAEKKTKLRVREHPSMGPYVEGLSTFAAKSFGDISMWIEVGNKQRATASTGMNDKSSRSHSVFTIVLTKTKTEYVEKEKHQHNTTSKINLVDLAGSERSSTANTTGDRLKEGANINQSLMTLGKVISHLCDRSQHKRKKAFIPYRDSVLTWLLKESLGGNSKTAMIATISPANTHIEETLSTLRYAKQARSIINLPKINEDPTAKLVRELRAEIERLKLNPIPFGSPFGDERKAEMSSLKQMLADSERNMAEMAKTWQEKLLESERRRMEEIAEMEKCGVSFKVNNKLPNLVNLNEDPQLSEVLIYLLREGETRIGQGKEKTRRRSILLSGALVAENHCLITNNDCEVHVEPQGIAPTYVNGVSIKRSTVLHHGDRLVIGDHYFRFNHPLQVDCTRSPHPEMQNASFEFARNELVAKQTAKLEAELEAVKLENRQTLLKEIQMAKAAAQEDLEEQKGMYERKLSQLSSQLKHHSRQHDTESQCKEKAEKRIEQLQQQNRILEHQVATNKKRAELETNQVAMVTQKGFEEHKDHHTRILLDLERQKQKMERSLRRLQESKAAREEAVHETNHIGSNVRSRHDLLRLSVWLQEANNISDRLIKHTVFSRHNSTTDEEDENDSVNAPESSSTRIKVTNTKLGIFTVWSLTKFEQKLVQMRQLYEDGNDDSESDGEEIFYDSHDKWIKDFILASPIVHGQRVASSSSSVCSPWPLARLRGLTVSCSSAPSSRPGSSASLQGNFSPLPSEWVMPVTNLPVLCMESLKLVLAKISQHGTREESFADKLLSAMSRIHAATSAVQQHRCNNDEAFSSQGDDHTTDPNQALLQATIAMNELSSVATLWCSHLAELDCSLVRDFTEQIQDSCRKVASHLSKMMQGCEGDIESMVTEAHTQTTQCLIFMARIIGELSIATDTKVTTFDLEAEMQTMVVEDLKQGFVSGSDAFIDKMLQGGIKGMLDCEGRLQIVLTQDGQLSQRVHPHHLNGPLSAHTHMTVLGCESPEKPVCMSLVILKYD